MQPLAVDPKLLRAVLAPEIKVLPGRALMARVVVANPNGRGSLSIAGYLLDAALPKNVQTGDDLRLIVREVTPERVLLSLSDEHQATPPAPLDTPPPLVSIPLPGGGSVQVTERDAGSAASGSDQSRGLTLRYDAPALGAVDLRFQLDPATLRLAVTVPRGASLKAAQAGSEDLRRNLADELGRPASVTVTPRREPLDVYA